jgi:hypothetical protein
MNSGVDIVWTFVVIILSNLLISSVLFVVNHYVGRIPDTLTLEMYFQYALRILFGAFAAAGLSLIPLFVGLRKRSVPGTIVTAVLIVAIFTSSTGGFSLYSITAIPFALAVIGILVAYLSIRDVDKVDLI